MKYYLIIFLLTLLNTGQELKCMPLEGLGNAITDTQRVHIISDAVWELQSKNVKLADSLAMLELAYGKSGGYPKYLAEAYNDAGTVKYRLGDFVTSKAYFLASLKIRKELNDLKDIGSSLGKLGAVYQKTGDLDSALQCQLECLKIQEQLNIPANIAMTYNNIAVIHSNQKNYHKAIEYGNKALRINIEQKAQAAVLTNYNTLANSYIGLKDYDSAMMLLDTIVAIAIRNNDKAALAGAYCNIGTVYDQRSDSARSLVYYEKALALAHEINNKANIAVYSCNIGNVYLQKKEYAKAESYLLDAYNTGKTIDQKQIVFESSFSLYLVYKNRGDIVEASKYIEESIAVKDSIFNSKSSEQIAEMQAKYETEKKDQQLQIKQLELDKRNNILIILVIIILLSALIAWLYYNRYKLRQKMAMDREILTQQKLRTKEVLDAEIHERERIGSELHDGVGQILSAAKLNLSSLAAKIPVSEIMQQQQAGNAIQLIDESVKEIREISHNMMPYSLSRLGLEATIRNYLNKISGSGLEVEFDITCMDKRLDATVESVLFRIFQELINNVIKHAAATHVTVQLLQHENELVMMIEDNGRGFDTHQMLQSGSGIGLKNIRARIAYLGGTVEFDAKKDRGTTVTVNINLA